MSPWLYVPVTIHLENNHHKEHTDQTPKYIALGGIYIVNPLNNSYYVLTLNTVRDPERYTYKLTCSLLISQTTIEWIPLTLCDIKYLKEESSSGTRLNPFVQGITEKEQFKFKPFSAQNISLLSLQFSSLSESVHRSIFKIDKLSAINFQSPHNVPIPSKVCIQCCPFSLTNVAIFSNYKLFGSINYNINQGAGYLSDIRYLDNTIGGIVNLDHQDTSLTNSVGLVCGSLTKTNGDGELLLIVSWNKIFQLLSYPELTIENNIKSQLSIEDVSNEIYDDEDPINSCIRLSVSTSEGEFWGSGIILLDDTIITNLHVLKLDKFIDVEVSFPNNPGLILRRKDFDFFKSPLIGFDLCFMKLKNSSIQLPKPVNISNSFYKPLKCGQHVKSIGHGLFYTRDPKQLRPFHSDGFINTVVSTNLDKTSDLKEIALLLVSASCWNGSSGGGLFNENNELIGIMTSNGKLSTGEILPNFTLAIPINIIEKALFMLKNDLDPIDLNKEVSNLWSLKNTHGDVILGHVNHKL